MAFSYTLDQLQAFVAVADTGSFSAAGRELHRVQSAISYTVGQLELALDAPLFDRSGRRPQLTEAGERLLAEARVVLTQADALAACAEGLRQGDESQLRLMVDALFPSNVLMDALARLSKAFPYTLVRLSSGLMSDVVEAVSTGRVDIGICDLAGGASADLHTRFLGTVALVPVCAGAHALAEAGETTPTVLLERHVQVVHTERDDAGTADQGVIGARTWRVTDLAMKAELIRRGVGWGGLPQAMIEDELDAGTLVRLHPEAWAPGGHQLPMHAVTRSGAPQGRAQTWLSEQLRTAWGSAA